MKGKIELSRLFQSAGGFPLHGQAGEFQIGFRVGTDGIPIPSAPPPSELGVNPWRRRRTNRRASLAPIEFQLPLFSV